MEWQVWSVAADRLLIRTRAPPCLLPPPPHPTRPLSVSSHCAVLSMQLCLAGSDCDTHFEGTSGQNQYLSHLTDKLPGPVTSSEQVRAPQVFGLCLSTSPQRLIVDTDMGFDVDDAVALCLANR